MAIVNSAATFAGIGAEVLSNIAVAIITTASPGQTVRVPASGSFSPAVTRGYARFKLYAQTVAISFVSAQLQASDGTNTVVIDEVGPPVAVAITATAYVDYMWDFILDTSTAGGGATGTLIFGGATFFQFLITTSGASGACSGDFEVVAAP